MCVSHDYDWLLTVPMHQALPFKWWVCMPMHKYYYLINLHVVQEEDNILLERLLGVVLDAVLDVRARMC